MFAVFQDDYFNVRFTKRIIKNNVYYFVSFVNMIFIVTYMKHLFKQKLPPCISMAAVLFVKNYSSSCFFFLEKTAVSKTVIP